MSQPDQKTLRAAAAPAPSARADGAGAAGQVKADGPTLGICDRLYLGCPSALALSDCTRVYPYKMQISSSCAGVTQPFDFKRKSPTESAFSAVSDGRFERVRRSMENSECPPGGPKNFLDMRCRV